MNWSLAHIHKYLYCENDPINGADPTGMLGIFSAQFGYDAEDVITNIYAFDHPNDKVLFGKWTRLGTLTGGLFRLKPDIFNLLSIA